MPDYVSVGVMAAHVAAGAVAEIRLCPLCRSVLVYPNPPDGSRVCTKPDCQLQQSVVTSECMLPVENIPRAVARKLRGELDGNSGRSLTGAHITEIATLTEKQILEMNKVVNSLPGLSGGTNA